MTMQVEHRTIARPTGFALLDKFAARVINRFKAWRTEQIERAEIDALEALGPEILDDIGVTVRKAGKPPKSIAVCNPHLIATAALSTTPSQERGEF